MRHRPDGGPAPAALAAGQAQAQAAPLTDAALMPAPLELDNVDTDTVTELVRRLRDIDNSLRAAVEQMGQLYMFADLSQAPALTRCLDLPMRSASHNERAFAGLLDDLQMIARSRAAQAALAPSASPAAVPQASPPPAAGVRGRVRPAPGRKP